MAVNTDDRTTHAVISTDREFRHLFAERFRKIADVNPRKTYSNNRRKDKEKRNQNASKLLI